MHFVSKAATVILTTIVRNNHTSRMKDLVVIINELQNLDPYELYRLSIWIRHEINQPQTIYKISNQLKIGDRITWFSARGNSEQLGTIEYKGRTKITIKAENGERWTTSYSSINTKQLKPILPTHHNTKFTKNDFSIGEDVEFTNSDKYYCGKIIKLNPKTAKVKLFDQFVTWLVYYGNLNKLIDSNANCIIGELIHG